MQDAIAALRVFYDADFRTFGFPEVSATDGPASMAASIVNAYTDAIFDRNRVIAAHALGV